MSKTNKAVIFTKIPDSFPVAGEHLKIKSRPYEEPELKDGDLWVKLLYVSVDPYMRGRMRDSSIKSYSPAFEIDKPMNGAVIVEVVKSKNSSFKEGSYIRSQLAWEEYQTVSKETIEKLQIKVLENTADIDWEVYLGAAGMPGFTAYYGLYDIGKPKKGETIFISSAAGAVGQIVGALALREGLTVIGSVGSKEKVDYLKKIGFHEAWNYKDISTSDALGKYAPKGIDIYFDNVGGEQLEAALSHANQNGRFAICGMISQYNLPRDKQYGVKTLTNIIGKRLLIKGYIQGDHQADWYGKFQDQVPGWIGKGEVKHKEHVTNGFDSIPDALVGMLKGDNFGKAVVKV